jgi:hypothetical protein
MRSTMVVTRIVLTFVGLITLLWFRYSDENTTVGPDKHIGMNYAAIEVLNPTGPFTVTVSGLNEDAVKSVALERLKGNEVVTAESGLDGWGNPTTLYYSQPLQYSDTIYTDDRDVSFRIQGDPSMEISVRERLHGFQGVVVLLFFLIAMATSIELVSLDPL